ncbi:MAG: hypothetical protein GWN58_47620 [Anaerolineae bacterium]|nr:hypothetical protein [Anaerolineae bacterium]
MGGEAIQIERRCEPNPEAVAAYHRAYGVYQHVHEALKEPLVRLNSLHGT